MLGRQRLALLSFALLLVSCARTDSETREEERESGSSIGRVKQAIVGGSRSDESQDSVVMIFNYDPVENKRKGICTGALIAPRLVLTARHCVADVNIDLLACDVDGTPLRGGEIGLNFDPANQFIFTGKDRPEGIGFEPPDLDKSKWKPASVGQEILDDRSGTLCNHDLALILLKDAINNVPIATIRLDGEAKVGETLLTVGWGVSSGEIEPKVRQQRAGDVSVKRVGPDNSIPTLTKSEFLFNESICLGDSGGPVFAQATNAIIGVVSRGGNGEDPRGGGPAFTCIQANNIGTKLSPFKELVTSGFQKAGAEPKLEPKEDDDCSAAPIGSVRRSPSMFLIGMVVGIIALITARRVRSRI
jgi:hypothetical protein